MFIRAYVCVVSTELIFASILVYGGVNAVASSNKDLGYHCRKDTHMYYSCRKFHTAHGQQHPATTHFIPIYKYYEALKGIRSFSRHANPPSPLHWTNYLHANPHHRRCLLGGYGPAVARLPWHARITLLAGTA